MADQESNKSDIVNRLRWDMRYTRGHVPVTLEDAAKEIEHLIGRLRDCLDKCNIGHEKLASECERLRAVVQDEIGWLREDGRPYISECQERGDILEQELKEQE